MPKEVLRSGAPETKVTPAATTTTVAAAPKADPHAKAIKEMEDRLKAMNLDPTLIAAALAAERKKLDASAPKETATVAPAKVVEKKTEPKVEKPVEKPAEKVVEKTVAAAQPAEEEFAAAAAREYEESGATEPHPDEEPPAAPSSEVAVAGAAPDHDDEESPGAVVVQNHWSQASEGAITGPIDRSDFKTPQVKIVQGSGPLSQKFNQGTLIYLDIAIFQPPAPDQPGPPMNFVPVAIRKYFRENLPSGSQANPRNANTAEDVKRLGGTTEFTVDAGGNRIKPSWAPAAQCLVIIERPENCDHPGFTLALNIGGKDRFFAPAVLYVNGGQYRAFIKPIMDATNFILCEGTGQDRKIVLEKRLWKMQVVKEKSGDNMVFNPRITMLPEATPQDLKDYAKSLRG